MRAVAAAALLATATGCGPSNANPYETSSLSYELDRREKAVFEMERREVESASTPRVHEYKGLDHELSDWRAAVLDKSDAQRLTALRARSAESIARLEAQEKELATYPAPMVADQLVDVRRALALERAKLRLTEAKISGR